MRISAIQNQVNYQRTLPKTNSHIVASVNHQQQPTVPSFKGMNGGLVGLGTGSIAGLLGVCVPLIAGVFALPAVVGGAVMVAAGLGGAALGSEIEDKIKGTKKDQIREFYYSKFIAKRGENYIASFFITNKM